MKRLIQFRKSLKVLYHSVLRTVQLLLCCSCDISEKLELLQSHSTDIQAIQIIHLIILLFFQFLQNWFSHFKTHYIMQSIAFEILKVFSRGEHPFPEPLLTRLQASFVRLLTKVLHDHK